MVKKVRANAKRNKKTKEKENTEEQGSPDAVATSNTAVSNGSRNNSNTSNNTSEQRYAGHGPMYTILSNAQNSETFHKRYIKEMKQLYSKVGCSECGLLGLKSNCNCVTVCSLPVGSRCLHVHIHPNVQNDSGGGRQQRVRQYRARLLCQVRHQL